MLMRRRTSEHMPRLSARVELSVVLVRGERYRVYAWALLADERQFLQWAIVPIALYVG